MKATLVLICLSWLCLINAAPSRRTRHATSTTNAGFIAKYLHIPEFLKFSFFRNKTTNPPVNMMELPQQKSRFWRMLDSVNVFKRSKPFGEPYLRVYVNDNGTYKWYFVYPGEMLYPAPDGFSPDLLSTLPTTTPTTTTTTTTTEPPSGLHDDRYKPLYPLGKIEFVQNQSEPKENEGAITILNPGPIFQPYVKIQPPFDEPIFQQFQGNDQDDREQQENTESEPEPDEEYESVKEKTKKRARKHEQKEEPDEEDQPADEDHQADEPEEQYQEENTEVYDNGEPEDNVGEDENAPQDDEKQDADVTEDEDVPEKKATKSKKPSAG